MPDTTSDRDLLLTDGLSRRTLVRTSAIAGLGALVLAACSTSADDASPSNASGNDEDAAPVDMEQEIVDAVRAAGFGDLTPDWTVIVANFEVHTGPGRLQMGLLDETQTPAADRKVELAIVRTGDLKVVQRIDDPLFYGEGLGLRGVYVFETDLPDENLYYLVAASEGHVGAAPMQVFSPEKSRVSRVGQPFPIAPTPTADDDQGLVQLCTRDPDCTMHDTSLDAALAAGKPVVLVVATPLYCQTAVCGPVVDVVEDVKLEGVGPDVTFIHAEVFSDAGNTPTPIINALQLPSEPWTFLIGSDGVLADRFDGPVVPELLRAAVQDLT